MQKTLYFFTLLLVCCLTSCGQSKKQIEEDFSQIYNDLSNNYVYLKEKYVDMDCIKKSYKAKIRLLKSKDDILLYFEYLLDEFYDSHLTLSANINKSYRLHSPVFSQTIKGETTITMVWKSQIENTLPHNIIGSKVLKFNSMDFNKMIDAFPTDCNDKTRDDIRTWIGNKILAGRYTEPRHLELKLINGNVVTINLDDLKFKKEKTLVSSRKIDSIGIIRIHNSLGNNELISQFDKALENVMDSNGLIIDLRNTIDGGNTYVARGIMSRFISEPKPYQKHWTYQRFSNQPLLERSWIEFVSPRNKQYTKPVVVLVGRWTGSMGEGITIGFDAMERGIVVGTEMRKLVGSMYGYKFKNQNFGYQLSAEKMYHVNGTLREDYIPKNLIFPTSIDRDEILENGIAILKTQMK